jgi:hypothetical protein
MSHGEQDSSPPRGTAEVSSLVDELLLIHGDFSRLLMYIGEPHVLSMNGFMLGFRACLGLKGIEDERYYRFREWLRNEKKELPLEGWYVKYLRDCGDDHVRAIKKLLNLAAEFDAADRQVAAVTRERE